MKITKVVLVLKSLSKRRLATSLTILQLSICIFSFLILIQFNRYYYSRYSLYNKVIDTNGILVVDRFSYKSSNHPNIKAEFDDILKLKNDGYISEIRILRQGKSLKVNKNYYAYYQASENVFSKLDIKIDKGRMFTHEEMNNSLSSEETPIIVGSKLGKMLKIGDTLDESYKYNGPEINGEYKRVFKVVAIAKPGSLITLPSDSTIFDVFINDYAIYAPLTTWKYYLTDKTKDKTYINKAITDQEKYNLEYKVDGNKVVIYNDDFTNAIINLDFEIVVEKNINIDTVKQLCNQVGKKNGSNLEFIQLENKNKPLIEILNQSCIGVLVFSIVLFLFSVFGIAGTTLYSISNRKKEFGIRMSQGATLYEIAILIFNEILFTNVIAAVVVIVPFKVLETYLNKYLNNNIELSYLLSFSFRNLLEVLILVLITTILAAIIPMRQVMKLNIVELLRGGN